MRMWIEIPESIHETAVKPFVHPGPLRGQEAAAVLVRLRGMDVDLAMTDVIVAADDQLRPLPTQEGDVFEIAADGFGLPLRNAFAVASEEEIVIRQL